MSQRDEIKTDAIVLRRTNYGETDRIINFLTPAGQVSCIAKGVRKEKSKLAGSIEMFTISNITIHFSQKSDLGILTSAKMKVFYNNLLKSFSRLELASDIIKHASKTASSIDSPELFTLVTDCLNALNNGHSEDLIKLYYFANLSRISGEQLNLIRDTNGEKLSAELTYVWDSYERALTPNPAGHITSEHIKLMRLILSTPLKTILSVKDVENYLEELKIMV